MRANDGKRPRSPRGAGGALRDEILAAADQLLIEGGSDAEISLRAIARQAGVATMTLYRHFDNLDELLIAVKQVHYRELARVLDDATAGPAGGLHSLATAYVEYGLRNPGFYHAMFTRSVTNLPADARMPGHEIFATVFTAVANQLRLPVEAPATRRWSFYLWTALHGIVHLRHSRHGIDWPDVEDQVADVLSALPAPGDPR